MSSIGYARVMGSPVGPMIGQRIGFVPLLMRYSVNSLPSMFTVTRPGCCSTDISELMAALGNNSQATEQAVSQWRKGRMDGSSLWQNIEAARGRRTVYPRRHPNRPPSRLPHGTSATGSLI